MTFDPLCLGTTVVPQQLSSSDVVPPGGTQLPPSPEQALPEHDAEILYPVERSKPDGTLHEHATKSVPSQSAYQVAPQLSLVPGQ
jgi:hypothetical protein